MLDVAVGLAGSGFSGFDEASGVVDEEESGSAVGAVVVPSVDDEDDCWWVVGWRSMTVEEVLACFESKAKLREVSMKMMAVPTVTLLRKVPGPRLPNTVWEDPPNDAPISAPLPA